MKLEDVQNGKRVRLSMGFDSKSKMLYFAYGWSFFLPSLFFLRMLWTEREVPLVGVLLTIVFCGAMFVAAYRYFNKSVMSEDLLIYPNELQLVKKGLLRRSVRSFAVADISGLQYLQKQAMTPHPLAGESFDYLGFQTQQQVINEMHGERRISFSWKGYTIKFGDEVYSWEFDELARAVIEVTGRDLQEEQITEADLAL